MYFRRCVIFATMMLLPVMAFGQSLNSSISGTVTDASGAVVPGAELTLTSVQRQMSNKSTSGSDGLYSFPNLVPGNYELKVVAKGFKPTIQKGLSVTVSQLARVDVRLASTYGSMLAPMFKPSKFRRL